MCCLCLVLIVSSLFSVFTFGVGSLIYSVCCYHSRYCRLALICQGVDCWLKLRQNCLCLTFARITTELSSNCLRIGKWHFWIKFFFLLSLSLSLSHSNLSLEFAKVYLPNRISLWLVDFRKKHVYCWHCHSVSYYPTLATDFFISYFIMVFMLVY